MHHESLLQVPLQKRHGYMEKKKKFSLMKKSVMKKREKEKRGMKKERKKGYSHVSQKGRETKRKGVQVHISIRHHTCTS